jgi:hypothetical protein
MALRDRGVALRRSADGAWVVELSTDKEAATVLESGSGRTPSEAYYDALSALAGTRGSGSQEPLVLVRNGDNAARLAATPEDNSRRGERSWRCTPDGVIEI